MRIMPYPAVACYTVPKMPRPIEPVMLHSTGGKRAGDLWMLSGHDVTHPVSCHYYITKLGELYPLVQDKDIAWHAGTCRPWIGLNVGAVSIGIELENLNDGTDAYTPAQLAAAVALVRAKLDEYNLAADRVIRHADYAIPQGRRTDPVRLDRGKFMALVTATENQEPRTFTGRYSVKAGGATIRQACWRTKENEAGKLVPGTVVDMDEIKFR